ncbi:hypothetical protein O181_065972 [Austropuccinia psidii MF-1]|uniref:Secreted protein n=1 Tax=Austropuccinia psidii MF-1 TaxID=1389203 RepID=A0A9Q3I3T9_9BASI|nr:hypothetical protein [Austropuccinia psidii MF-1]
MQSTWYLSFAAVSLVFFYGYSISTSKPVRCSREYNTLDFAPNFTVDVPVNCVDLWHGEYTCARSSCKNYDSRSNGQVGFKNCWVLPEHYNFNEGDINSYRIYRECNKIELSLAPYPASPAVSSRWCSFNIKNNYNTDRMTCGNCVYNKTSKAKPVKCGSLPN